jgi:acylphosphatase
VQGVGYRYASHKVATHLGLTGWVRNRQDGRVEAVFEGDRPVDLFKNKKNGQGELLKFRF